AEARMLGEQVPAARAAPLAQAVAGPLVAADALCAASDAQAVGPPQREGVDGCGRPLPARLAVAVTRRHRRSPAGEPDRAAETLTVVTRLLTHAPPPRRQIEARMTRGLRRRRQGEAPHVSGAPPHLSATHHF